MKKILSFILILVILASVPVFGMSEASYIDSTWLNFDPDYSVWMIIMTPYKDRANIKYDISSIIKRQIEDDLTDAMDNVSEITKEFNTDTTEYVLKSLFDLTVTDTVVKLLETKSGTSLRLKVDAGLTEGEIPFILQKVESAGTWLPVPEGRFWVNEDQSLTLVLDSFCPIMVLLETEVEQAEKIVATPEIMPEPWDGNSNPILWALIGISVVGLIIAAFFFNIFETKRNNSRVFFALQRVKLNIEIAIARRRAR